MRIILIVTSLLFVGCSSTNIAELVKAMAGDTATVCVTAQWGGGMVNASRTNIQNGDVQCQPNGLTVKSQREVIVSPATVTVAPSH